MKSNVNYFLLYDADCGICSKLAEWLCKNNYGLQFSIQPYQEFDFSKFPNIPLELVDETIILINSKNGEFFVQSDAILLIMYLMGGNYQRISKITHYFKLTEIVNIFYKFIAKNRSKLSQILGLKSCKIKYNISE